MGCKPCAQRRRSREIPKLGKREQYIQDATLEMPVFERKAFINCFCGLSRILPGNPQPDEIVILPACPRCGSPLKARMTALHVLEEIIDELS